MEHSARIEEYLAGTDLLRRSIAGMSHEQLLARPVAGKWSTHEVVCHLADFDPIIADRMKRVIAEDNPSLLGADENRFAGRLAYDQRYVEEEVAIIAVTRSQMARILRSLTDADFIRSGVHNEAGPLTLLQLLNRGIGHIAHHVKFIEEKRKALGLPIG